MFNNVSYRQFGVNGGPTNFTFSPVGSTIRMQPAIMAWTGATISQVEPDPGNDGIWFMGYKVTNPSAGVWHYEYALYNENLDRGIQSRRRRNLAGQTTARKTTWVIAARHGVLLRRLVR